MTRQVSLQQLLASEWASQLQLLDLSECSRFGVTEGGWLSMVVVNV